MKYTEFEPWMVGQRIYWDGCGNSELATYGTVVERQARSKGIIWARWDDDGLENPISLDLIIFPNIGNHTHSFTNTQNMQEITINGKRYKLTLIEE